MKTTIKTILAVTTLAITVTATAADNPGVNLATCGGVYTAIATITAADANTSALFKQRGNQAINAAVQYDANAPQTARNTYKYVLDNTQANTPGFADKVNSISKSCNQVMPQYVANFR